MLVRAATLERSIGIFYCIDPHSLPVEAARRRLDEAPRQPQGRTPPPTPSQDCHPLVQLCMKDLTSRICDPRTQMTLSGLPAGLAERFLVHLIKEKLLRPKTLQLFLSW